MKNDLELLVREAQSGSAKAFSKLYGFYAHDLYRFALYYTRNEADAEDCVQEAVLSAFKNITKLKKPSSFKSWSFKILSNVCKTKLSNSADLLRNVPIQNIRESEACSDFVDLGMSADICAALDKLDDTERQIVLLSVIGRYKSGEIASILELTAGTVRSKLSRSLKKLRDILQ